MDAENGVGEKARFEEQGAALKTIIPIAFARLLVEGLGDCEIGTLIVLASPDGRATLTLGLRKLDISDIPPHKGSSYRMLITSYVHDPSTKQIARIYGLMLDPDLTYWTNHDAGTHSTDDSGIFSQNPRATAEGICLAISSWEIKT